MTIPRSCRQQAFPRLALADLDFALLAWLAGGLHRHATFSWRQSSRDDKLFSQAIVQYETMLLTPQVVPGHR